MIAALLKAPPANFSEELAKEARFHGVWSGGPCEVFHHAPSTKRELTHAHLEVIVSTAVICTGPRPATASAHRM